LLTPGYFLRPLRGPTTLERSAPALDVGAEKKRSLWIRALA